MLYLIEYLDLFDGKFLNDEKRNEARFILISKLWFERKKTLTLFEKFDCNRRERNVDSAKKFNAENNNESYS